MTSAPATALQTFLENRRSPDTPSYHELQGFLFAVVSAPDLVSPEEWIREAFGDREVEFADDDEAGRVMNGLMALYDSIDATLNAEDVLLPPDCVFREDLLANLEEDAPVAQWSRGFIHGHQWLAESWEPHIPEEMEDEHAMELAVLCFFASRDVADEIAAEMERGLEETAAMMRDAFSAALSDYVDLGCVIGAALSEGEGEPVRRESKIGRNDLCPCGSGRKYKKCCGAA